MKSEQKPAMSDLERINRSYVSGSQTYTPSRLEDEDSTQTEDQKDSKRGKLYPPASQA
jgi:hypothetical protein